VGGGVGGGRGWGPGGVEGHGTRTGGGNFFLFVFLFFFFFFFFFCFFYFFFIFPFFFFFFFFQAARVCVRRADVVHPGGFQSGERLRACFLPKGNLTSVFSNQSAERSAVMREGSCACSVRPLIMFKHERDPIFAARAIEAGAKGTVSKYGDRHDLVAAISAVSAGGVYSRIVARSIAFAGPSLRKNPRRKLTSRESRSCACSAPAKVLSEIAWMIMWLTKTIAHILP